MVTEIEKEEAKALNRAVEIAEFALQHAKARFTKRQFHMNMYHSFDEVLKQKQWWQTKFAHPFPFFTTEMKASFYYEGVFGPNSQGIWVVHPWDESSTSSAEKTTKLLKSQEQNSNFNKTFYLGAKNLSIMGDWFLEAYWDIQERVIQRRPAPVFDFDGQIKKPVIRRPAQSTPEIITDKNQPDARTLYVNSVWPDPKATSIENARYICVRRERTFDELKQDEFFRGRYTNVDKLKGTGLPKMPAHFYDTEPANPYVKSGNPDSVRKNSPVDEDNPIVEVIDIFYPETGEVETIGNRSVYLGTIKLYDNLNFPIVHIKNFEELGKFWGTSDYEAAVGPWRLINQKESLMADNELMHLRGYTKVARDAGEGVVESLENLYPDAIIEMNNLGAIQHERPNMYSPLVIQTKDALLNQVQQPLGINEILSGATPSSNVRSQEQFSTLANFGAKILSQSIRNISQGLQDLGKKWLMLNYEFLDVDQTVPVLGQSGTEILKIQPGDVPPLANISVRMGVDLEAQKAQKLQQMLQAINLAQQVPGFNTPDLIRQWFRTQGVVEDVDSMFLLEDEQIQQLILSQFGAGGGISQEPAAAGATQVPSSTQIAQGNANANSATSPEA